MVPPLLLGFPGFAQQVGFVPPSPPPAPSYLQLQGHQEATRPLLSALLLGECSQVTPQPPNHRFRRASQVTPWLGDRTTEVAVDSIFVPR